MRNTLRFAPLLAGLLAFGPAGCSSGDGLNHGGKLTGKVTIDGQPLKGGNVTVLSENGKHSVQGFINGEGTYSVPEPPLGKVTIVVQTAHLRGSVVPKGDPSAKGAGKGEGSRGMTLPDPKDIGLGYTDIPERYESGATSGLTVEVKPGDQTHNIELTRK